MDLSNFIKLIESDANKIGNMASNKITYNEVVKKYKLTALKKDYIIKINLFTLDVINTSNLPYKIKSSVFNIIRNSNILKPKLRKERRTFINFLKLYFPYKYKEIEFINRESPDFKIFKNDKTFSYEIVQAVINPVFEKLLYYNSGKNLNEKDYEKKIEQYFPSKVNKFFIQKTNNSIVLSPGKGLSNTEIIRDQIIKMIIKKINKYKDFNDKGFEKNIIVFCNEIGFSQKSDFIDIKNKIISSDKIVNSMIDKIFVINNLHKKLIEYNKDGKVVNHTK